MAKAGFSAHKKREFVVIRGTINNERCLHELLRVIFTITTQAGPGLLVFNMITLALSSHDFARINMSINNFEVLTWPV